jgi:hypothetical protein
MAQVLTSRVGVAGPERGLDYLPRIDYRSHPAYGGSFPAPGLGLRFKALAKFLPWFGFVAAKRALLFDRLPVLPSYSGPMSGGVLGRLMQGPRYLPLIAGAMGRQLAQVVVPRRVPLSPAGAALLETFRRDGIVTTNIPEAKVEEIKQEVAPRLDDLLRRRENLGKRSFEGNQLFFTPRDATGLYRALHEALTGCGIMEAASAYQKRTVAVKHVIVQVNDPHDSFNYNKFADVGVSDPRTNYMHVDTSYDTLKVAVYLNEVTEANGPFCYVRGTHRLKVGALEGLIRRTNDRAGLSGYSRGMRQLFLALPGFLRHKSTFGSDLPDDSREAQALVEGEYQYTSKDGNVGMFDNLGVHRGALVHEGERRILFVTLA